MTEILRNMKKGNKSNLEKNELIKDLVDKIQKRAAEIKKMKITESEALEKQLDFKIQDVDDQNLKDMGLYNFDKDGQGPQKGVRVLKNDLEADEEDMFMVRNSLKI